MKALDKEGDGFKYLIEVFPFLSDAKLKKGPQIKELIHDRQVKEKLKESIRIFEQQDI